MYSAVEYLQLKNKEEKVESYKALSVKKQEKDNIYIERDEDSLINDFIENNEIGILEIIGESGLGKSFTLNKIIEELNEVNLLVFSC